MVLLICSTNKSTSSSLPSNLIGLTMAKGCCIVLTSMLGGVKVSGVASLGPSATAGAFPLLDTVDMLESDSLLWFRLRLGKYALEPSRSLRIRCAQIGSRYLILLSLGL